MKDINITKEDLDFKTEIHQNCSIEEMIKLYPDSLIIVANGSATSSVKKGKYRYELIYHDKTLYVENEFDTTSANRAAIKAVSVAVNRINRSCKIVVITAVHIGMVNAFRSKGINAIEIQNIFKILKDKKCTLTEAYFVNGSREIKRFFRKSNKSNSSKINEM